MTNEAGHRFEARSEPGKAAVRGIEKSSEPSKILLIVLLTLAALMIALVISGCIMGKGEGYITGEKGTLRAAAGRRHLLIGTCVKSPVVPSISKDPEYAATLARQFNLVTGENCMKFGPLCPAERGKYNFAELDALVDFAESKHMMVRGVPLVWHLQNPKWLTEGKWTRDELVAILEEHIRTVVGRYKGRIFAWDVVNEHIGTPDSLWTKGIGPEYVDMAFRWAREADPRALLFYNDFLIEDGGGKFEQVHQLAKSMKERGVPIDGIGFQFHVNADTSLTSAQLSGVFQRVRVLGLQIHITELDVAIKNPITEERLLRQAEVYRLVLQAALSEPNCTVFQMWGFTDRNSWIPGFTKGMSGAALIFDAQFRPKPAYYALRETLEGSK